MRAVLIGMSLLFLGSLDCRSTEIVAIRTKTFVVIGADSKFVQYGSFSGQKLFEVGGVVFGTADLETGDDLKINYRQLTGKALDDTRVPIATRLIRMEDVLQRNLTATLSNMRRYPIYYGKYRTVPMLQVLVVGFDGAIPHVYVRRFHAEETTDPPSVTIERHDCPGDCESNPTAIGSTTQRSEYISSHSSNYKTIEKALDGVCGTIKAEMKAVPYWLGPPIQMAVIDRQGIHWQQPRDANCQKK